MMEQPSTEQIWRDFSAQLRGFIRARVRDDAVADDLLQETFLKIHTRLPQLKNRELLAPWIYRIARNAIIDYYRARSHEPLELAAEMAAPQLPLLDNDDSQMNQIVGFWLRGFLATMPEKYRQAVEMVELECKTMDDLAKAGQVSISGAKSRVQRGRKMLQQRLHDCCHVELDRRGNVLDVSAHQCCADSLTVQQINPPRTLQSSGKPARQTLVPRGSQHN